MSGKVSINGIPFDVASVRVADNQFFCDLRRLERPLSDNNALFFCSEAAIYAEDYCLVDGKIKGDVVLYTLEHEDFTELDLQLVDEKLTGRGKATIMGEPCDVEIVAPIDFR